MSTHDVSQRAAVKRAPTSDLLGQWAAWRATSPPFILEADRPILATERSGRAAVTLGGWLEAYRSSDFCAPHDKRLHLGLLPQPFFGDLRRASIYVLLLNPGLGPHDYYGEYEVAVYREALLANLRQEFAPGVIPFLFLDPQFAWHGGFGWWHRKFAGVIERLASSWRVPFAEARSRLAARLASIELIPYHSPGFRDAGGWIGRLHSVSLAKAYVKNVVLPRVRRGKAIAIVSRVARAWRLPAEPGVIIYTGQQARAAHLTPDSPGGRAILEHLGVHQPRRG